MTASNYSGEPLFQAAPCGGQPAGVGAAASAVTFAGGTLALRVYRPPQTASFPYIMSMNSASGTIDINTLTTTLSTGTFTVNGMSLGGGNALTLAAAKGGSLIVEGNGDLGRWCTTQPRQPLSSKHRAEPAW